MLGCSSSGGLLGDPEDLRYEIGYYGAGFDTDLRGEPDVDVAFVFNDSIRPTRHGAMDLIA